MPNYSRQELVDPPIYGRLERCVDMLHECANYHQLAGDTAAAIGCLKTVIYLKTEHVGRLGKSFEDTVSGQRDLLRAERAAAFGGGRLRHNLTVLPEHGRHT